MRHLWHLPIRNLLTRKARSLLTTLGVVLGVAMVVAIAVTYDSAEAHVKRWVRFWHGGAQLRLRPKHGDALDPACLEALRRIPGVRLVAPHYCRWCGINRGKKYHSLLMMAVDPEADSEIKGFVSGYEDIINETIEKGERPILLRDVLAKKLKAKVGDEVSVLVDQKRPTFRLVGILSRDSFPRTTPWSAGVVTLAEAREFLGDSPALTAVDILVTDDADINDVSKRASQIVGATVFVERPETRTEAFHNNLRVAKLTARIISATTLFVGVFIIFNTMAMTVVERKRETGMLRAIGASRRQIGLIVLCEAAFMGIVGTALGILFGLGVARLATSHMGKKGLPDFVVSPSVLIGGAGMGLAATFVAALIPAVLAARVSPLEATRPFRRAAGGRTPTYRLALGIVLLVGLTVILHIPFRTSIKVPILATAGIFSLYFGAALVAPFFVAPLSRVTLPLLGVLLRSIVFLLSLPYVIVRALLAAVLGLSAHQSAAWLRSIGARARESAAGVSGKLAHGNLVRSSGRTALTACALMVGVSFVVDLSGDAKSVIGEFRRTLDAFAGADLFVLPQTPIAPSLDPEKFRRIEGVEAVTAMKLLLVDAPGGPVKHSFFASGKIMFIAIEPDTFQRIMRIECNSGELGEALDALKKGNRVLISSDLVRLGGPRKGGTLRLNGVHGEVPFEVAGEIRDPRLAIYTDWRDWSDIRGIIGSFVAIGTIEDARKYFGATGYDFALVRLRQEGIDRGAVGRKVRGTAWRTGCKAQWIGGRNTHMIENAYEALYSINAVLFVAVLIAALAVLNTMTMNVIERTREIGVLRALGTTRTQILEMFLTEAAAIGVIGALLGAAVGLLLMHASLTLNRMVMGWQAEFVVPYWEIAFAGVAGVVVAIVGGIYPALRAARIRIVEAIQME
ncbi:MAG: ABC transporter permease [Planctomycetes bacterium]|nr:ABC transporter permease [Planctomycetota bacterium]